MKGLTTETGAGQWGTALSEACSYFGIPLTVYMVKVSYEQKPFRKAVMQTFDAGVIASPSNTTNVGRQILAEDPDCTGMGTTLVAALAGNGKAVLLNEGDSRAYHINEDGITRLTRDHSVVEDMVARGDITPEEARTHPRKNLITRALGSEERIRADLYEKELQPGDFLLLCSDGLSNIVTDQELLYEAIHGGEPSDCCQRLLHITLSRGAPDNVTAVLFQIV